MTYNKIYVTFGALRKIISAPVNYQYDVTQILVIQDLELPEYYEVDFCNEGDSATKTMVGTASGVEIPDNYLKTGKNVKAYVVIAGSEEDVQTRYEITIPVTQRPLRDDIQMTSDQQLQVDALVAALNDGVERAETAAEAAEASSDTVKEVTASTRVTSLDETGLAGARVIEAVGSPVYVDDVTQHAAYGIAETGWYIFARIAAPGGVTVGANASVTGAAGVIMTEGADYVDVAVKFEVAAISQEVTVDWGTVTETFVFKATDLAIRNLDYRVTFYVYDIEEKGFVTWEYALTTDTTFSADKNYYLKNGDVYTLAEVTAGEAVPADTYYNHSKVTFAGMVRNITYVCNTPIDCPITFILPEIEDETHGCWFEVRCLFLGTYSMTLVPPSSDIKVATEHTQQEQKGVNMIDLHYTAISGTKVWRFMNTRSTVPA